MSSGTLIFSTTFTILCEVVCQVHRSVHASNQAHTPAVEASVVARYDKLKGTEPGVCSALVRRTAQELGPVLEQTGGALPSPLPGKALVVLDPAARLVLEMIPWEDGHAQERKLLPATAALIQAGELWIADRNICTLGWVEMVDQAQACFVVRQHGNFPLEPLEPFRPAGRSATGEVSEQRVRVVLDQPTRDGQTELYLLTNLPAAEADALRVAELYRERGTIERVFQEIEATLESEINTLANPRAVLLGLCIGVVAHNTLAVVKAAMRAAHGAETVETQVSGYYLAAELESTSRGLDIALPERTWVIFSQMSPQRLANELMALARGMFLRRYKKHPRGPKKPRPPRRRLGRGRGSHVSTFRLLAAAKQSKFSP